MSFQGSLFYGSKQCFAAIKKATLKRHVGPMYINFDEYSPYSGAISDFLKQIAMPVLSAVMNNHIQLPKA